MSYSALKKAAFQIQQQAPFITEIRSEKDYQDALLLMDDLMDDYDENTLLIDLLAASIERWEDNDVAFEEFNKLNSEDDPALSILRLLMDQYQLGVSDIPEIGSKSLVSKILNNRDRKLTRQHIEALSQRFGISPALFF